VATDRLSRTASIWRLGRPSTYERSASTPISPARGARPAVLRARAAVFAGATARVAWVEDSFTHGVHVSSKNFSNRVSGSSTGMPPSAIARSMGTARLPTMTNAAISCQVLGKDRQVIAVVSVSVASPLYRGAYLSSFSDWPPCRILVASELQ